jgi:hypothetical protein
MCEILGFLPPPLSRRANPVLPTPPNLVMWILRCPALLRLTEKEFAWCFQVAQTLRLFASWINRTVLILV